MHICDLNLGSDPWTALEQARLTGEMNWDGGRPLPVTVGIRGAHSRKFARRSVQLSFRHQPLLFGPPGNHPVRRLHLNADYIDPTRIRSRLSFALFEAVGAPAPTAEHALLVMSGEVAGIYVALESVDSDFCRRRGWEPGPIFYAINRNANFGLISPFTRTMKQPLEAGYQPVSRADPAPIRQMLTDLNLASDRSFPRAAERWLDVEGYLDWLMIAVFVGNRDGFVHNYALCFDPGCDRFRMIPWDYDATFGIDVNGRPARLDRVPAGGWNKLSHRFLALESYRKFYRHRFLSAMDGALGERSVAAIIDKICHEIRPWIDRDGSLSGFEAGIGELSSWVNSRRDLLRRAVAEL